MPLHTILFYGGSILHEKTTQDTTRVTRGHYQNEFNSLFTDYEDEEPVYRAPPKPKGALGEGEWEHRLEMSRAAFEKRLTKWRAATDAMERYEELSAEAAQKDAEVLQTYSQLLLNYDVHQYLRCIHEHLAEFLAPQECTYLLHRGLNVLSQGRKSFYVHTPAHHHNKHIRRRDSDEEVQRKMGEGALVGAFARTASVTDYSKYAGPPLEMPAKVRFIKKTGTNEHNVIPAASPVPERHQAVTVNGEQTVDNKSSVVMLADMDAFIGDMIDKDVGFPAFTVSDCNSFHTSGYMWALYALRQVQGVQRDFSTNDPVLFLNFDQHTDAGTAGDMVASDRWGAPALSQLTNGMYMSFGCGARSADFSHGLGKEYQWTNVFMCRNSADGGGTKTMDTAEARQISLAEGRGRSYLTLTPKEQFQYVSGILCSLKGRWDAVEGQPKRAALTGLGHAGTELTGVGPLANFYHDLQNMDLRRVFLDFWTAFARYLGRPIKHVYVTVDRDSIQGHQTQWGDNSLFPNAYSLFHTITSVVDPVFEACPNAKLIGFDITGLPEARAVYDVHTAHILDVDSAWDEMLDELSLMYQWTKQRISPVPGFLNKAWSIFAGLSNYVNMGAFKGVLPTTVQKKITDFTDKLTRLMDGTQSVSSKGAFASKHRSELELIRDALQQANGKFWLGARTHATFFKDYAQDLTLLLEYIAI